MSRPITRGELQGLWPVYLRSVGASDAEPSLTEALNWACRPTPSGVSLVTESPEGVLAGDYSVALRNGTRPDGPVETALPTAFWEALVATMPPTDLYAVGSEAQAAGELAAAELAWDRARTSDDPGVASRAHFFLGTLRLDELGKPDEAIKVFDACVERFGQSSDVEVRKAVAYCIANKGLALRATARGLHSGMGCGPERLQRETRG